MRQQLGQPFAGRRRTFPTVKVARGDSGEWFGRTPILVQKDLDGAALERRSVISLPPAFTKRALVGRLKRHAKQPSTDIRVARLSQVTRGASGSPHAAPMPPTPLRDNLNDMAARTTRAAEKARIDAARRKADGKVRAQRRAADARSAAFRARRAVATFRCRGDGLRRCVNGRRASFAIDAPHKNLKFFAALESATHRYELDVVEDPAGAYACSYVVAAPPGPYELSILLDDEVPLPGSPFATTVAAGAPCALTGSNEAAPGERMDMTCATPTAMRRLSTCASRGPRRRRGTPSWCELTPRPAHRSSSTRPATAGRYAARRSPSAWCLHHPPVGSPEAPEPPPPTGVPPPPPGPPPGAPPRAPPVALSPSTPRRPVGSRAALSAVRGDADVRATLRSADAALRGLFAAYAKASPTRGVQILTFEDVLALCGDFDIAPSLVDADAILSLYRVVEKQKKARGLAYAQFLDLLALVARAALLDELATDAACVNARSLPLGVGRSRAARAGRRG